MLDVNNAFGNNSLQFNPQFQALSSLVNQQSSTNSSINFTDLLASAQAESEQIQDETSGNSIMGQQLQCASSSLSLIPVAQFAVASSSSSYPTPPVEESQTDSQPAAVTQAGPTNYAALSTPASSPVVDAAAAETAQSVVQTDTPDPTPSADSIPATGQAAASQTETSFSASVNSKPKATASAQPAFPQDTAARSGSTSQVDKPDLQGQIAAAQKSSAAAPIVAPLIDPASGFTPAAANQKASASPSATSDQPEPVAPSTVADAKSTDRVRARKENATEVAKNATGVSGPGTDPVISTTQTDSISNPASPLHTGTSSPAASPNSPSAGKGDSNSDLAFALKIQGNDPIVNSVNQLNPPAIAAPDHSDLAAQTADGAFSSQLTESLGILEPKVAAKSGASSDLAGTAGATGQFNVNSLAAVTSAITTSPNAAGETAPAEKAAPASALLEDQPVTVQPVKTVQVQISGEDDQKVDLKLVEKSGVLTMSVRSSDASLTRSLQQNLPDLTAKLSDQQIRAEWWRPDIQQTGSSKDSGNSSGGGNSSTNPDQGNQNKGNSGQQGGRGTPQPDWLEDLTTSNNSNQNGTQFTWHL